MTYRCPACGSTQLHGDSNTVVAGARFQPGSQPYAYRLGNWLMAKKAHPLDTEETQ